MQLDVALLLSSQSSIMIEGCIWVHLVISRGRSCRCSSLAYVTCFPFICFCLFFTFVTLVHTNMMQAKQFLFVLLAHDS